MSNLSTKSSLSTSATIKRDPEVKLYLNIVSLSRFGWWRINLVHYSYVINPRSSDWNASVCRIFKPMVKKNEPFNWWCYTDDDQLTDDDFCDVIRMKFTMTIWSKLKLLVGNIVSPIDRPENCLICSVQ